MCGALIYLLTKDYNLTEIRSSFKGSKSASCAFPLMLPHVCSELIPQMWPWDYSTAWADRSWEQNSLTIKKVEVINKSEQCVKGVSYVQFCENRTFFMNCSLTSPLSSGLLLMKPHLPVIASKRELCKPSEGEGRRWFSDFFKYRGAKLGFNTHVPLIVWRNALRLLCWICMKDNLDTHQL